MVPQVHISILKKIPNVRTDLKTDGSLYEVICFKHENAYEELVAITYSEHCKYSFALYLKNLQRLTTIYEITSGNYIKHHT